MQHFVKVFTEIDGSKKIKHDVEYVKKKLLEEYRLK